MYIGMPLGGAFDPATHTYTYQGEPWPSVTQIIAPYAGGFYGGQEAAELGTLVHALIAGGITCEIPPQVQGKLDAWSAFLRDTNIVIETAEVPVFHLQKRYAGTIDALVTLNGRTGVLDIKTGMPALWHGWQLAGYNLIALCEARWAVYLSDGRYTLREYTDLADYTRFLTYLDAAWGINESQGTGVSED